MIYANDPDLLGGHAPEQITMVQLATARAFGPFRELIAKNATNWTIVAAASAAWARKVFPEVAPDIALARLWDAITSLCRLDRPDPTAAWRAHLAALDARKDHLNDRRYSALLYSGPGTSFTIGLPDQHVWVSGQSTSGNGILFAANLPTEEVFTMPHKDRVDGLVSATKPLSYGGSLIEHVRLRFSGGRIVEASASAGEQVLRGLLATDEGAARLGEIALVPHGSPISKSGLLFYSTLFDENAGSHLAVGSAYKSTLSDGEEMSDEDFEGAGGDRSVTHVDLMIGSGELDVDGCHADGTTEPVITAVVPASLVLANPIVTVTSLFASYRVEAPIEGLTPLSRTERLVLLEQGAPSRFLLYANRLANIRILEPTGVTLGSIGRPADADTLRTLTLDATQMKLKQSCCSATTNGRSCLRCRHATKAPTVKARDRVVVDSDVATFELDSGVDTAPKAMWGTTQLTVTRVDAKTLRLTGLKQAGTTASASSQSIEFTFAAGKSTATLEVINSRIESIAR